MRGGEGGTCLPCRRCCPAGWLCPCRACFACRIIAFSLPSPRPRSQSALPLRGRGRFLGFLMQGASPLASPGLSRKRHWLTFPLWHPAGSLPGGSPDDSAFPESTGGLACFACRVIVFSPPFPQPPSPPGKGEIFWFSYARGFAPCIPGTEPGRHWLTLPLWHPAGSLPGWSPDDYAFPESAGGLACFAARRPRLDLSLFPPSPSPLPLRGRGRIFSFLMQGASPLASPGLNPRGTYSPCRRCCPAGGLAPAFSVLPAIS